MRVAGPSVGPSAGERRAATNEERTMSRKQDFDPQAIPNFGGGGRIGETDPNEPEEQQSSAQIVQDAESGVQTDPAAGAAPAGPAIPAGPAGDATVAAEAAGSPSSPAERPRTVRDDRARGETHVHNDNPEPPAASRP
jgi:hypothetical protein